MKIIEAGDNRAGGWWMGHVIECSHCGRKLRLERNDWRHIDWIPVLDPREVRVQCENCRVPMVLRQPGVLVEA